MTRRLLVVLATGVGMLVAAPAASAFTTEPVWQCRGSAAIVSVAGQNRVEPIVANGNINTANGASPDRAQCVDSETGAGNTPTQLGIDPSFLGAVTGKASTEINPDLGRAIDQAILAEGRVEDLSLAARRRGCDARRRRGELDRGREVRRPATWSRSSPATAGWPTSRSVARRCRSTSSSIQLTNLLNPILGALVEIKADERIQTADSLTINALHVKVIRGNAPVVDLDRRSGEGRRRRRGLRPEQAERRLRRPDRPGLRRPARSSTRSTATSASSRPAPAARASARSSSVGPTRARAVARSFRSTSPASATATRRACRVRRSAEVRDRRHEQGRPHHGLEHRRPDHRPRRQRQARRRSRQRLHRGPHGRRQHLRRPGQRQAVRQLGQGPPQRRSRHGLHVGRQPATTRSTARSARTPPSAARVATSSTSRRPDRPRSASTAARATTSPASTTTSAGA